MEDAAGGGDATLGKLSAEQIGKGQAVLEQIKAALDGGGGDIAELSSQFYSLIPTQVRVGVRVRVRVSLTLTLALALTQPEPEPLAQPEPETPPQPEPQP